MVIMAILRIHDDGSQKTERLIVVLNFIIIVIILYFVK